ncbi:hypothetical protein Tco_1422233 [Tanacetum coccineum]
MPKNVSHSKEALLNNLVEVPVKIMFVEDSSVFNVGVLAAPDQPHTSYKHGGSSNTSSRFEEFQSLLSASELFEFPFKGINYT